MTQVPLAADPIEVMASVLEPNAADAGDATRAVEKAEEIMSALRSSGLAVVPASGFDRIVAQYDIAVEALQFYSDEATYHAVAFVADPPAGSFMDDFSEDEGSEYERPMPGKTARAALSAINAMISAAPGQNQDQP